MFMLMYAHDWRGLLISMHTGTDLAAPESPLVLLATDAHLDLVDLQCSEAASDLGS
jgi:hypothetical protein